MTQQMPPPLPPNFGAMYPAYPPPRRRCGFASMIFTTLAWLIFLGAIGLSLVLLMYIGITHGGNDRMRSKNLRDGDPGTKIAVIPLRGLIATEAAQKFHQTLRDVQDDRDVKALIIELNTPGEVAVTASDEIYHDIEKYQSRHAQQSDHGDDGAGCQRRILRRLRR